MSSPLVLGQIALSFHAAAASVVQQVCEREGVAVVIKEAPHERIYEMLRDAEVDMVCSAWLPGSHGAYVAPYEDQLVKLGVLYQPYTLWGVPDYVPIDVLASVADLAKPEIVAKMNKRIQGIGPGAGISRFSREIIEHYALYKYGYEFHNGTLTECASAFEAAYAARDWVIVPLWHPQYLHSRYQIRELTEPNGLLRGKDAATLVIRKDALHKLTPRLQQTLTRMQLGNTQVAQLDYAISVQNISPPVAACQWLDQHPKELLQWTAGGTK